MRLGGANTATQASTKSSSSLGLALGPRGWLRGEPWIGPGDWQSQVNQEQGQRGHNARGGYSKAPAHVDGIGCPATGGTSLASPWPPLYLFVSLGGWRAEP